MIVATGILVLLIVLNGFFSASEIALVSLNENKVKKRADSGNQKAKKLYNLIAEPSRFLATIQIGITFAGFLASALASSYFAGPLAKVLGNSGVPVSQALLETISIVVITVILSYFTLVFGELAPKQLALQKAEAISNVAVKPLTWLFKACLPIVKFLQFSTNTTVRVLGVDPEAKNEEATEEDIRMMVDDSGEKGTIQKAEKSMIHNVFEFNDKTVSDIITHRTDMTVLSIDSTLQETVQLVNSKKFTRFPVHEGDNDNIIGVLHAKDLIQFLGKQNEEEFQLKEVIREPYFVLETQRLDILFRDMQRHNRHIAIIVDEHGGTDGLITIEDVIEEIVGEIFSENAGPEITEEEITKLNSCKYAISGTTPLHKVAYFLEIEFPTENFDTLSGFLIDQLGHFPTEGEQAEIHYKDCLFEVSEVAEKRIEKIIATVKRNEEK